VKDVTSFTVSVRAVDSRGGLSQPESVTVSVRDASSAVSGQGPDHPPVVDKVMAEWSQIERGKTGLLVCIANDPDGDKLTYNWQTDRGTISGQGRIVTYTAPLSYVDAKVTVTISDSRGGVTSGGVSFSVVCCAGAHRSPEWFQ